MELDEALVNSGICIQKVGHAGAAVSAAVSQLQRLNMDAIWSVCWLTL